MNQPPLIFLGAFAALALSWFGLIVQPQMQLGRAVQGTNIANTAELYPQARQGMAQRGLQVYRSLGCAACHTQQIQQDGAVFDLLFSSAGTNTVEVIEILAQLRPQTTKIEAGRLLSNFPVTVIAASHEKAALDTAAEAFSKAGAKAEVRMIALGPDIERGWGRARSVAADFLFDQPALPGQLRLGPDLANVGARLPSAEWHYRHLYDPKWAHPKSVMPPYRFLFETRPAKQTPFLEGYPLNPVSADRVIVGSRTNFVDGTSPVAAGEDAREMIVPSDDAKALVAYLLSLRNETPLFERPMAFAAAQATNAAVTNSTGASTNAVIAPPPNSPNP